MALLLQSYQNLNERMKQQIESLEARCMAAEPIQLKLNLEFKLMYQPPFSHGDNEWLWMDGSRCVAYLGISDFNEALPIELCGMVDPAYRRQGLFKHLAERVMHELKDRGNRVCLWVCDQQSPSGIAFLKESGVRLDFSEMKMVCSLPCPVPTQTNLGFRSATLQDEPVINHLHNAFLRAESGQDYDESDLYLLEEMKMGVHIYVATLDEAIIGKAHLLFEGEDAILFGLGIDERYRHRGYGTDLLIHALNQATLRGAQELHLEVMAENKEALRLYRRLGFHKTSSLGYYRI